MCVTVLTAAKATDETETYKLHGGYQEKRRCDPVFDEIRDTLSTALTIAISMGLICIFIGIIKGIFDCQKVEERKRCEEEENKQLINAIVVRSQKLSKEVLINERNEVYRAYNELEGCRRAGSMKVKEWVWISDGNTVGFGLDIDTCYTILQCLNQEIARRG